MTQDARFADAAPAGKPVRVLVETADDLAVVSALTQDAAARVGDAAWMPRRRRFALAMNRFRWEAGDAAPPERVRAVLSVENVLGVRAKGLDPTAKTAPVVLLAVDFTPADDGAGTLTLRLGGGATLELSVEALDLTLADVTRPWPASRKPRHKV
ncbi:MAG: DUF2948 family protein [Rhodobacteraceae bacterium]|nr:MAG: DUF2948 family protein [Paracoccaceae bacterium]